MPGDWHRGIQYSEEKWSLWADWEKKKEFRGFVLEGSYTFTVEARSIGTNQVEHISTTFSMHFVMPKILAEADTIDWQQIRKAPSNAARFSLLAEHFQQSHEIWLRVYEAEKNALTLTGKDQDFEMMINKAIVGKGASMLREWAAKEGGKSLLYDTFQNILVHRFIEMGTYY
jgi:hypothetical protein